MDKLLTTREAAQYLGMSKAAFLERDRWMGDPKVPFVRIGSRAVRNRKVDLDDYVVSRLRMSYILQMSSAQHNANIRHSMETTKFANQTDQRVFTHFSNRLVKVSILLAICFSSFAVMGVALPNLICFGLLYRIRNHRPPSSPHSPCATSFRF